MVSVLRFEIRVGQTWSGSSRAKSCAKHPIPKGCTCCRRDRVGGEVIRAAPQSGLRVETGFSRKPRQHRTADDRYRLASVRRSPPRHSWLRLGGSREALDKDIAQL